MRHHLIAADRVVRLPARERVSGAGGRQCLESEQLEQSGRADIPRIGNDERARLSMQQLKLARLFQLRLHRLSVSYQ
jgi:hypothetical protein